MSEENKPRRSHIAHIKIEADTWDDVISALYSIAQAREIEGPALTSVSGGHSFSWIWEHDEDENITHDQYFAEMQAWLKDHKEQKRLASLTSVCTTDPSVACCSCDEIMQAVRPGKWQCNNPACN